MGAMEGTGWRPVTQIAIDHVWSVLRFRQKEDVKSRKYKPRHDNRSNAIFMSLEQHSAF
jgi:hypothetical protein